MSYGPLKGKRLTTFCASLTLLHTLLSLTHWIFRSLMLPYKSSSHSASTAVTDSLDFRVADAPLQIQFASAKCVRCASLLSGGRRLAVRTAMEHPIGTLPRTPFASSRRSPQGETRDMKEKTASHILQVPFRRFPPLVAGATTFPPQFGGAAKGKRLNGQARRLTSPHLEVLCRTSTVAQ